MDVAAWLPAGNTHSALRTTCDFCDGHLMELSDRSVQVVMLVKEFGLTKRKQNCIFRLKLTKAALP